MPEQYRITVILAGGKSRRMSGFDKAVLQIGGERLIDRITAQVATQSDLQILSASHDYDTGLGFVPDVAGKLAGPAAGLYACARRFVDTHPDCKGFFTVPVDAPNIPLNLFVRLEEAGQSAIAETVSGLQPTFAYWECRALLAALEEIAPGETLSLKQLAERIGARRVLFENEAVFTNLNTPEDVAAFQG